MYKDYFEKEIKKIDISFLPEKIKSFIPSFTENIELDIKKFSLFWSSVNIEKKRLKKNKIISPKEVKYINDYSLLTKKIFLNKYSADIYKKITKNFELFIRVEQLCDIANEYIPCLLPNKEDLENENNLMLKEKEGIEREQGVFLSAILSNKKEGVHLCKSMLRPTNLALQKIDEFESVGKISLNGAQVELFENYNLVTLDNPYYLNAEDNRTLIPLETAIDIATMSKNNNICVLRGSKVNHRKYLNKRIFGAGINLTHLYEGKIPYLWYITRDMGAVNKVLRGHFDESAPLNNALFPNKNKIWFAGVDTFAIGGGCQYLLVMDHIIADKSSYMTLPARKEGIIPGAANLRLWRFVGNRVARQAIQHGLTIKSNSTNGKLICDNLVDYDKIDDAITNTVKDFKNSGVVGAGFNKRALILAEESLDDFRRYMSLYCHDQAYCHFSNELIKNLEKYWNKSKD